MSAGPQPPAPAKSNKVVNGVWIVVVVVVVLCVGVYFAGRDSGDSVDAPAAADQQQVVADLARASAAHGICYGWQLYNVTTKISSGSNLGAGVAVSDNPTQCPKYVEVRGTVHYYPSSSESEDYGSYSIVTNIPGTTGRFDANAFDRVGAGTGRLLDDPAVTILDAVELLPLLAQEAGLAATPVPEPSATGSVAPVETGGSDFFRDRWVLLLITGLLLLGALGTLLLGIRSSRRSKPEDEQKAPVLTVQT